jgi:hypothetical protein
MKSFKKLFLLTVMFCLGCYFLQLKVSANTYPGQERGELGYSYNLVRSPFFNKVEMLYGRPIYNEDWLASINYGIDTISYSKVISASSTSLNGVRDEVKMKLSHELGLNGKYGDFSGTVRNAFELSLDKTSESYLSTFHHYYSHIELRKRYWLPSFMVDIETYSSHFDDNFKREISRLQYKIQVGTIGNQDYFDFFELYGTHVLHDIYYGSKIESTYSIYTDYHVIDNSLRLKLEQDICLNYGSVISGNGETSLTLSEKLNYNTKSISEDYRTSTYGGSYTPSFHNYENFCNDYDDWKNSVSENNYEAVWINDYGLYEIWKILPSEYNLLSSRLESAFDLYNDLYAFDYSFKSKDTLEYTNIFERPGEKKITDSGRFNQHCDNVIDKFPQFQILKNLGYKKVNIKLVFDMKEEADGYQSIMIYLNEDVRGDDAFIVSTGFDLGGSRTVEDYTPKTCNWTISLDELLGPNKDNNGFCIRYGAHGWWSDTWCNKNMKVSLKFTK